MNNEFGRPLTSERTAVDKELHTDRHSVDGGLYRVERLVVRDGVSGPGEGHDTKLDDHGWDADGHRRLTTVNIPPFGRRHRHRF